MLEIFNEVMFDLTDRLGLKMAFTIAVFMIAWCIICTANAVGVLGSLIMSLVGFSIAGFGWMLPELRPGVTTEAVGSVLVFGLAIGGLGLILCVERSGEERERQRTKPLN